MNKCEAAKSYLSQLITVIAELNKLLSRHNKVDSRNFFNDYFKSKAEIERLKFKIETLIFVSEDQAEQLMKDKKLFLGSQAVEQLWGVKLEKNSVPPIPFSQKELERAVALEQVLMLVVDQDDHGKPLTVQNMFNIAKAKLPRAFLRLGVNFKPDSYQNEPLFNAETPLTNQPDHRRDPRARWILISKKPIPESSNENFLDQTTQLTTYVNTNIVPYIHNDRVKKIYQGAVNEFFLKSRSLSQEIKFAFTTVGPSWQQASKQQRLAIARKCTRLKINQLSRPNLATALYFLTMYLNHYETYPMNFNTKHLTNSYSEIVSPGHLAAMGMADYNQFFIPINSFDSPDARTFSNVCYFMRWI